MSYPLFSGFFNDAAASTHTLSSGNLLLEGFWIQPYYVETTAAGAQFLLTLKSTTLGNIFQNWAVFNTAANFGNLVAPPWQLTFPSAIPIPRGDTLSIVTSNFGGITTLNYSVNLYGQSVR